MPSMQAPAPSRESGGNHRLKTTSRKAGKTQSFNSTAKHFDTAVAERSSSGFIATTTRFVVLIVHQQKFSERNPAHEDSTEYRQVVGNSFSFNSIGYGPKHQPGSNSAASRSE